MSQSINKVELLGHVGITPELRQTQNGMSVCNFTLATSYQPQNGDEKTDWHRVTVWGAQADAVARYVDKGHRVLVHGRLNYSTWTDQQGNQRTSAEITADPFGGVIFLTPPSNQNGNNTVPNNRPMVAAQPAPMQDAGNLPFE